MFEKMEKEKLIKAEVNRLKRIYKKIGSEHGYTEKFQQGNQEPYDRTRPNAETYKAFYDSYLKTIKQLTDMLPKEEQKPDIDEFDEFVSSRPKI